MRVFMVFCLKLNDTITLFPSSEAQNERGDDSSVGFHVLCIVKLLNYPPKRQNYFHSWFFMIIALVQRCLGNLKFLIIFPRGYFRHVVRTRHQVSRIYVFWEACEVSIVSWQCLVVVFTGAPPCTLSHRGDCVIALRV